ncbi:MAG: sulfite exporter TauE/SafE family protein [Thermoleophilia bacterium]
MTLAAVGGGAINALAGGGTLITFPALTAMGVPALNANVTNTVALVPGYLGGTIAQRHDLHGQRRRVAVMALPAVAGGIIGGVLLFKTGAALFDSLVPWLILLATALLAAEPWLKRMAAQRLQPPATGKPENPVGVGVTAFAGAIYGGYFGAGLGIIMLALFSLVLPDSLRRVNALKQTLSLLANGAVAILFAATGKVVWSAAAVMAVGALLGGTLGGQFTGKVPAGILRGVMLALGLAVAVAFFLK